MENFATQFRLQPPFLTSSSLIGAITFSPVAVSIDDRFTRKMPLHEGDTEIYKQFSFIQTIQCKNIIKSSIAFNGCQPQ